MPPSPSPETATDALPPRTRRSAIALTLRERGAVTVTELQRRFAVSSATIRRDLGTLERRGMAQRTHGGAVVPSADLSTGAWTADVATERRRRLATAAFALLRPGESVFLDASPTALVLAQRIAEAGMPLRVFTNGVRAMRAVAASEHPRIELHAIGGALHAAGAAFVGPVAVAGVRGHFVDRLVLADAWVTRDGELVGAGEPDAAIKRAMLQQARDSLLLLDGSAPPPSPAAPIGPLAGLAAVLTVALRPHAADALRAHGVPVHALDA